MQGQRSKRKRKWPETDPTKGTSEHMQEADFPPIEATAEKVRDWAVCLLGISEELAKVLLKEQIDGEELREVTKGELVRLGMPHCTARKIVRAVAKQQTSGMKQPSVLQILVEAASRERAPAVVPVPFAGAHNVAFLPRMELIDTLVSALRTTKEKTLVLAILSTPGAGKSRLMDEMCAPETLTSLRRVLGEGDDAMWTPVLSFLEGLAASQRINLTFNQGNDRLLDWELQLPVRAALGIRVLHACFRSTAEDVYPRSYLYHVVRDLYIINPKALSVLDVCDILPAVFPGRRCALFIDEVQAMGQGLMDGPAHVRFIRDLAGALGSLDSVSTYGNVKAIVAGADPFLLHEGFELSNTLLETLRLPPFFPEQALLYVDRFLAANGPHLHPTWRVTPWLRELVAALGSIPRLLEKGLYAICEPHHYEMSMALLVSKVEGTSYLCNATKPAMRPMVMAVLVQAKASEYPDVAEKLIVCGAVCEVTRRPYMPPIALLHWASNASGDLPFLFRRVYNACSGGMNWDDFKFVANAATAFRMMALRERGHEAISLRDLFLLPEDHECVMADYLEGIEVVLPATIKLRTAERTFRLPERVPCHNVLLRNTVSSPSADSVIQLTVVGNARYDSVTIAFQDKLVSSGRADISKEPAKVFGPGAGTGVRDKDLLLLVIRSPFPVRATTMDEEESIAAGRPVILLHGGRFNRLFKAIMPSASSCLNTLSLPLIQRVLECSGAAARAVVDGRPWLNPDDLARRGPPGGKMAEETWATMVGTARLLHNSGLLFF